MNAADFQFSVTPEVLNLGVKGSYLMLTELENRETDNEFETFKHRVLDQLWEEYSAEGFMQADLVLAGFRALHIRVGRSNRKFLSAPEALVSRFSRTRALPHVNLLVDIYNLVSLKTRLALGAHDVRKIDGNVTLRITTGSESFVPLRASTREPIFPREYAYVDDHDDVICRMEVLQTEKTKVDLDTEEAFYIIQGNAQTPMESILATRDELVALTKRYCGGRERILYPER